MQQHEILRLLALHQQEIKRFRVKSISLFGSHARGDAGPESDVDLMVEFDGPATFDGYMDLKFF
jgi:hypothetical protein